MTYLVHFQKADSSDEAWIEAETKLSSNLFFVKLFDKANWMKTLAKNQYKKDIFKLMN